MMKLANYLWGPLTRDGVAAALVTALLDQASKLWLLYAFDLGSRDRVPVLPFLDLVLVWNKGISYGLFAQNSALGQMLLLGFKIVAAVFLWGWLARAENRLMAVSLGLIIGGAIGNAVDRLAHGAVVDFVLLHLTTATFTFNWYVFNLADVAIVAGVAGLMYETLLGARAAKAP
ncbi:signal peptidase II [Pseudorhodoplanes sinuspersici]|uniref:Lipoprotein signal peptidase n=1 Tax=Pseudorhodoplanes sinuspersici TaxID=1235591 RepID=A0A1W6ZRE3_9HYPH|nr:signal peptidase II [Pseudorhodoplanes sinuspersici]ARP99949.1 signal peptidase II [Pseudorhodoplanes sinuspersici]RKE70974.1 signal peptidase II [Pseudorhodoplanes sinuspersici]